MPNQKRLSAFEHAFRVIYSRRENTFYNDLFDAIVWTLFSLHSKPHSSLLYQSLIVPATSQIPQIAIHHDREHIV